MYLLARLISKQRQGWSNAKLLVDNNLQVSCSINHVIHTIHTLCSHDADPVVLENLSVSLYLIISALYL